MTHFNQNKYCNKNYIILANLISIDLCYKKYFLFSNVQNSKETTETQTRILHIISNGIKKKEQNVCRKN